METFALHGVTFEGQEEAHGHVAFVACDDGGVVVEQSCHESMGDSDLLAVEHYDADVLDGDCGSPSGVVALFLQFDQ